MKRKSRKRVCLKYPVILHHITTTRITDYSCYGNINFPFSVTSEMFWSRTEEARGEDRRDKESKGDVTRSHVI